MSADQVLARPVGESSTIASEEALAQYSSNVLKALYSTEISKQLGMDRYGLLRTERALVVVVVVVVIVVVIAGWWW